ncbi:uncharacterized protein LOC143883852 isoform X2 [Tasmannia lanceolata]|uniref:uncharacterized protein LOC143883852 isoform X2 n=1 Tax=Tasmannia lanceolata TaxID=3420 RepID=UPI004064873C
MAIFSRSSSSWIFSLKVFLLSTAVLSMALVLKLSVPLVFDFLVYEIPLLWNTLLSWLTPPYLYFVINGIIITIAASSRFQHKADEENLESVPMKNPAEIRSDFPIHAGYEGAVLKSPAQIRPDYEVSPVPAYDEPVARVSDMKAIGDVERRDEEDDFVISRSDWQLTRTDSTEIPSEYSFGTEKPLVSKRFGHRKSVKASPEGFKALGVSKSKRNETLESTWKTITDGRPIPLARHLKKSDTWETHGRPRTDTLEAASSPVMKKSETMNDRRSSPSPSPSPVSGRLRKEPSPSQDELNRRVEAFIKKFNEEIRLQRQESFKHYMDMVNRGSH